LGEAPIDFLEALAEACGKVEAPCTLNPSSFDSDYLARKYSGERREKQSRIVGLYERMGIKPTLTCTPYYLEKPRMGWHLAWAESSATVYANSVLGAWTNREGGPSALAAALTGKTPNYGVHRAENRRASVIIEVESRLTDETEFGALGIHVGKLLKDKVPIFEGLSNFANEDLKQLGAGMASSGMTSMFHFGELREKSGLEKVSVDVEDVKNAVEGLSTTHETPDLVFIGCPHCSLNEVKKVAEAVEGKKVRKGTELWVCTSQHVKGKAEKHVNIIEAAGGHVLCDTCAIVTWIKDLGIDAMMTNSAKTAYYAPTLNGVDVTLAPLSECVRSACNR